ncbi:hypothetical protein [Thalassotalea profundi]|uniref:Uncharacterized protein n=1 Tax=Thalassotalea profundi TaxID=2036687 RepID=A0ABQ3IR07_9GAMM|nr:hypothetical protein [Thalassotalea profundi]GHE88249.1 hypothetical protein GCM10011501_17070 [Thalassotalea profundi]
MTSTIQNTMNTGIQMPSSNQSNYSLTQSQQSLISETLSEFDLDNLTESDAVSIIETFSEAGIKPSAALEKTLSELGIDAKSLGDLANVSEKGNRPPPPPKQSTDEISSMVDYLTELLEETLSASDTGKLSEEDKESILAKVFEEFNIEEGDSIINTTA